MQPCPNCQTRKWATQLDRRDFRKTVLHCMECGFEVDVRVVRESRRILHRATAQQDRGADVVSES